MSNLFTLFESIAKLETLECLITITEILKNCGYEIETDCDNFTIATPPNPSPIALIAHCDTVGKSPPAKLRCRSGVVTSGEQGGGIIGADDRAGVTAIVQLVADGHRPQVYLTTGEETGGIGADELSKYTDCAESVRVLVQLDRQSGNDYVTYDCDNPKLDNWCQKFGFAKSRGSFTDISILAPDWGIAGANLSVGYTGQHSDQETLVLPQLAHTIARVARMIARPPKRHLTYIPALRRDWSKITYPPLSRAPIALPPLPSDDIMGGLTNDDTLPLWGDSEKCEQCGQVVDYREIDGRGACLDCQASWRIATR